MFEYDKYYKSCIQNNHPFIKAKVNPINGFYNVQVDLLPCKYHLSEKGTYYLKKLFEKENEFLKSNNLNKSLFNNYSIDKELSWFDGVVPKHLNSFCEHLYDLSTKYYD